jgi:hypothetical protein
MQQKASLDLCDLFAYSNDLMFGHQPNIPKRQDSQYGYFYRGVPSPLATQMRFFFAFIVSRSFKDRQDEQRDSITCPLLSVSTLKIKQKAPLLRVNML